MSILSLSLRQPISSDGVNPTLELKVNRFTVTRNCCFWLSPNLSLVDIKTCQYTVFPRAIADSTNPEDFSKYWKQGLPKSSKLSIENITKIYPNAKKTSIFVYNLDRALYVDIDSSLISSTNLQKRCKT
uniref:Uncharacterized protein n=1 Tax=Glossina pallidipes TaxID=7398 RepID=A0A1B0ADI4_GLOPL